MSPVLLVVLAVVVIFALVALALNNRRRRHDGVDSFRRQIDALSPEARRTVVDQVQKAERQRTDDDAAGRDDEADGGGARGA